MCVNDNLINKTWHFGLFDRIKSQVITTEAAETAKNSYGG